MVFIVACYIPQTITDPKTGKVYVLNKKGEKAGYVHQSADGLGWEVAEDPFPFNVAPDIEKIGTHLQEEEGEELTLVIEEV